MENDVFNEIQLYDLAVNSRISIVSITCQNDRPDLTFSLFRLIADSNVNIGIILQQNVSDISNITFTVMDTALDKVLELIKNSNDYFVIQDIRVNKNAAMISLMGIGLMTNTSIVTRLYECMFRANIGIEMISTSEIKISLLINNKFVDKAINAIRDAFPL